MKRLFTSIIVALAAIAAGAQTEFTADGFTYQVTEGNTVTLTQAPNTEGDVVIPSTVTNEGQEYTVTAIGANAFNGCTALTAITLPNTVKTIGAYAFQNVGNNADVEEVAIWLGTGLTTIGERAFNNCDKMKNITIPASVTYIESSAFWNMDADINVTIEDSDEPLTLNCNGSSFWTIFEANASVRAYVGRNIIRTGSYEGRQVFDSSLTELTIGPKVTAIGDQEYVDCSGLTVLNGMENVESIGESAFNSCSNLTSVVFGSKLKTLGAYAFYKCYAMENIDFSQATDLTYLPERCFDNNDAVVSITIPAHITTIESNAFWNMGADIEVTIEDSDEPLTLNCNGSFYTIFEDNASVRAYVGRNIIRTGSYEGRQVFDSSLTELTIGPKVTAIGDNEYNDCWGLLTLSGMENVESIGTLAFNNCRQLTSVPIGNKLTTMGDFAFQDCRLLESISLPGSLKVIPYEAFENCFALASVTLGEGIEEIGNGAFYDTDALTEITIPASVKKIGRAPFYCNSTQAMKRMIIADSDTPLEFANGTNEYSWGRGNLTDDITLDYFYLGRDVNRAYFEHSLAYGAKEIEIGPKVTTISGTKGLFYATDNVESVKVHHVTPIAITDDDFQKSKGVYENATLWVPGGTVADYQAAEGWKNFKNIQTWSYVVNFAATGHGSIAIDDEVAKGGETKLTRKPNGDVLNNSRFTVTLTPETGYELTSLTQEDLTEATQAEEIFKGNDSFTNPFTVETAINHDLTYVATFAPITYTITYDLAGGQLPEGKENPKEYTIESEAITLTNPTRTGYDFLGWTGTGLTEPTVTVTIAKGSIDNRTYTATWKANSYKVHFDANNGEGEMADQTFTYDEAAKALTANAFTRLGYTFTGWNSQADGSGTAYTDKQEVKNLTATDGATITLYAQWQIVTYTITYNLDGGTVEGNPTEYTVETETFTLENPTREGYTFTGWTGTGLTEPTMTVTIVKGSTGEREYFATYEEIPVIIPADVNGDGAVDVADIATVISVMAGSAAQFETAADVNGDGAVDVADIASIISEMAARARMQEAKDM